MFSFLNYFAWLDLPHYVPGGEAYVNGDSKNVMAMPCSEIVMEQCLGIRTPVLPTLTKPKRGPLPCSLSFLPLIYPYSLPQTLKSTC